MSRRIIDSHVHFWDPQRLHYAWLASVPAIDRAYLTDHVPPRVGNASVEGIVFVQADCAADEGLAEVEFVTALAAQDARVRGIVAFAALEQGRAARGVLDALQQNPLVKGVRRLIQDEPQGFAMQANFVEGVQQLAAYGFSFDICIRHWQLPDAIELVRACPRVNFVLDHCGKPDIRNQVMEPWRGQITELAQFPNISCKLSGLVTEADMQNWQPRDLAPYIEHVLDAFGSPRVMFGSDAPVAYLASAYERWVETLAEATQNLTDDAQERMWRANAAAFYRL